MAQVSIRIEGLPEFLRGLKQYAPEVRKLFLKRARSIAAAIADDARGRASWSRRIPGAIGPVVQAGRIGVRVNKKRAPHGPLYELGSKGNTGIVRHPLFGNRKFWYSEPARPFLAPAVEAKRDEMVRQMLDAVEQVGRGVGLE